MWEAGAANFVILLGGGVYREYVLVGIGGVCLVCMSVM